MAANENSPLPDDIVDKGLEAFDTEASKWQIVGPLEERRPNLPPREFWNVVREPRSSIILDQNKEPEPLVIHMKSKEYAFACVRWHSLQAALEAVKQELAAG